MKNFFLNLYNEELGQDMVEYALVVGIIALGAVAIMGTVATNISTIFSKVASKITSAGNSIS